MTPRSGGQTPRSGSLPGSDHQDHHQHLQQQQQQAHHAFPQSAHHQHVSESVGYPISPSPRPQSRRLNSRESVSNARNHRLRWSGAPETRRLTQTDTDRQTSGGWSLNGLEDITWLFVARVGNNFFKQLGQLKKIKTLVFVDDFKSNRCHEGNIKCGRNFKIVSYH